MGSPRWEGWKNDKPSELGKGFVRGLDIIRENPIVDVLSDPHLTSHFYGGLLCDLKDDGRPHYSLGVHPMTVRELRMQESSISKGRREYSRRWWGQLTQFDIFDFNNTDRRYPHKSWMDKPIYESGEMFDIQYSEAPNRWLLKTMHRRRRDEQTAVIVNLDLPDSVLLESFKQWLVMARSETHTTKISKQYRKPDFESWARMGVLPWFDLTIWAKESGTSIPNRVMADAIFSRGEGGEEAVRKTTEPLALRLIGKGSYRGMNPLYALGAQAAHEKAAQAGEKAEEKDVRTFPE